MNRNPIVNAKALRASRFVLCALLASTLAFSQEPSYSPQPPSPAAPATPPQPASATISNGWPRADGPAQADPSQQESANSENSPQQQSDPGYSSPQSYPASPQGYPPQSYPSAQNGPGSNGGSPNAAHNSGGYTQGPPPYLARPSQGGGYQQPPVYGNAQASGPVPDQLTISPGTFVTVRLNQTLSSDANHPGDQFSATLVRPLVVDGVVIAQRGQTLGGHVVEAEKAGRIQGTSRLRIQVTGLTLVDGQQVPIQSQFIGVQGPKSIGRDAAAIAGTTGAGAVIGGIAGWGTGAAIGAGAGAAAGVIGVLLTRGKPTIVSTESELTFRIETPVTISTVRAPQAFHYVEPFDYDQPQDHQAPTYAAAPPPSLYGGPGYYPGWGPSLVFFGGPGFYGPGFYGRPGFWGPRYGGYYGGYRGGFYRGGFRR